MLNTSFVPKSDLVNGCKLIDFNNAIKITAPVWIRNGVSGSLERLLAIHKINHLYQSMPFQLRPVEFCRKSLEVLNINYAVTEQELAAIPEIGPLVIIANHPFGGIEGIILSEILFNIRPDVRILGNYLLHQIPQLREKIIAVDPFNSRKAAVRNAAAIRKTVKWLKDGGALIAFPSGEVSHWCGKTAKIVDPPWSVHITRLITMAKAKTIPVYIHGRNSLLFSLVGMIHPRLRTLLLPREMVRKKSATIQLSIGKPILWQRLKAIGPEQPATAFLRFNTYLLKHRKVTSAASVPKRLIGFKEGPKLHPVVAPVHKAYLKAEIDALPAANLLLRQNMFRIYMTTAGESPAIMQEIGRLRELSFRDVDEGTGRSIDRDEFDSYYLQLFLWNQEKEEIVGAYRLGETDRILEFKGSKGLYTTALFDYKPAFVGHLDGALELGRSFIRTEYQKKFGCLSILWRGIGEFVARNCQYRYLFGPVSISRNYHTISRNLIVEFLQRNKMENELKALVKPRYAPKIRTCARDNIYFDCTRCVDIEDISLLISEIENDRKGVPTLIKHYLKLNGRFLAFNLDRAFANVIDGLVWVDLLKTTPKFLNRFMGKVGTADFLNYHHITDPLS
ncbi:MAG: lysophospholipid acyltransferase family protein [Desulfobacteraceae bacterium]|jgi:putative hemolysin